MKKLFKTHFSIDTYMNEINGFIRFECEIKKKKLESIYSKKYIRVRNVNYRELYKVWKCDFMKLLSMFESDLKIVRNKEKVENRLFSIYGNIKGRRLYNFYLSLIIDGIDIVKSRTSKNVYYTNIRELKNAGVDFSQKLNIDFDEDIIDFNPFEWQEVI